jgi:hypothetical protein
MVKQAFRFAALIAALATTATAHGVQRSDAPTPAAASRDLRFAEVKLSEQEEAELIKACRRRTTDGDVQAFCECFAGGVENDFSPEEYRSYRETLAAKRAPEGALKARVDFETEDCRSLTSGAH